MATHDVDLLYIAFVDLKGEVNSGSGVRPQKMAHAFERLGLRTKILDGWPNDRAKRRASCRSLLSWLETHTVGCCYIEPPTGPLFVREDRMILKKIREKKIPTGIFYRDLFWKFPQKFYGVHALKVQVIRALQKRDLRLFRQTMDLFFFPSERAAEAADFGVPWKALPPGTDDSPNGAAMQDPSFLQNERQRFQQKGALHAFYVGGILGDYGLDLLLDSMTFLNRQETKLTLTVVCRPAEWEKFQEIYPIEEQPWLRVVHAQGAELEPLYEEADLAFIPFHQTEYMDFSVPIKLMEYISHLKPMVVTNCAATASFVQTNEIGWVAEDNPRAIMEQLEWILAHREDIVRKEQNLLVCRAENTWEKRAEEALRAIRDAAHKEDV